MMSVYQSIEETEDKLFPVLPQGIGVGMGPHMKKKAFELL